MSYIVWFLIITGVDTQDLAPFLSESECRLAQAQILTDPDRGTKCQERQIKLDVRAEPAAANSLPESHTDPTQDRPRRVRV